MENSWSISIIDSPRLNEISELSKSLYNMPEYKLWLELAAFDNSIYNFAANFDQLEKFMLLLTTDQKFDHLYYPENNDIMEDVTREFIRLIHNFVASAYSLKEHAIIFVNRYKTKNLFPDYSEKARSTFSKDPVSTFVQKFRVYCQHVRLPKLGIETSVSQDGNATRRVMLSRDSLLEFNDWGSLVKEFLISSPRNIDILNVFSKYRDTVLIFYTWFQSRQEEIHNKELEHFERKQMGYFAIVIEDKIDVCLKYRNSQLPYHGEEIFSGLFSRDDFEILKQIPGQSVERGKKAVELLSLHIQVSTGLAEKILQLYSEPNFYKYL